MADCIEYQGYRTRDGHTKLRFMGQSAISNIITQRFRKEALNCANL